MDVKVDVSLMQDIEIGRNCGRGSLAENSIGADCACIVVAITSVVAEWGRIWVIGSGAGGCENVELGNGDFEWATGLLTTPNRLTAPRAEIVWPAWASPR